MGTCKAFGILYLAIGLSLAAPDSALSQEKVALLVGIGNYDSPQLAALHAEHGIRLMESTLLAKGFKRDHILILRDSAATRDGLVSAFTQHLPKAGPGGVAVFHFYGHGERVRDDNGDEADGMDEALLLYASQRSLSASSASLMRDDELGLMVQTLQRQLGPQGQVVTILDACHSGSGLRAGHFSKEASRQSLGSAGDTHQSAQLVAFYSSRPDQPSLEVRVEGNQRCALLTWAFCKALNQMHRDNTYRGLFEKTMIYMTRQHRRQIPEIEGNPDQLIFGMPASPPPPYFRILAILGNEEILLDGGSLHGMTPGRKLTLQPPDTRTTTGQVPLATAEVLVEGTTLTEARARLSRAIHADTLVQAWVFPEKQARERPTWAIHAGSVLPHDLQRIADHVRPSGDINWSEREDAELILLGRPGKVALKHPDGSAASDWIDPASTVDLDRLAAQLDAYAKGRFIRGLQLDEADCLLSLHLGSDNPNEATTANESGTLGMRAAARNTTVSVHNTCQRPIFYTIIDVDPLNRIRILAPAENHLASEYRLLPGETNQPISVQFDMPGTRVIKLIATPEPTDLRGILTSPSSRLTSTEVERLISPELFWEAGTRGATAQGKQEQKVGITTLYLDIR